MDDESTLRDLMAHALRNAGYNVLEASDGSEGLEVVEQHAGRIDLMVSDIIMPRISGSELAQRLRQIRPGIPVILVSGRAEAAYFGQVQHEEYAEKVLHKPFRVAELIKRVAAALGRDPDSSLSGMPRLQAVSGI